MNKRVVDFVEKVAGTNEFYRRKYEGVDIHDWEKIPVLSKDEVREMYKDMVSTNKKISWERTSGSTGKILNIAWNGYEKSISLIGLWEERAKFGITPNSKGCFFHSINYRAYTSEDYEINLAQVVESGNIISFNKLRFDDSDLMVYYNTLKEREIEWILCHPSTLVIIMTFMKKNKLQLLSSVKYIELAGEYLPIELERELRDFFKTTIRNEYGMREINGIAFECENGHMHCIEKNVYVEVIGEDNQVLKDGENGEICVTGLHNCVMPFIRYKSGDRGCILRNHKCMCGRTSPILCLQAGRTNELVSRKNKNPLESVLFFYIVEYINNFYDHCVIQFKVIQNDVDSFEVYLVLKEKTYIDDIKDLFIRKATEFDIIDVEWQFKFVEEITPNEKTEKLAFFENQIKC